MRKRKLILKPATLNNCKVGNTVFDLRYGLGTITDIESSTSCSDYPIHVKHDSGLDSYTTFGKWLIDAKSPSLFLIPDGITISDYETISLEFNIGDYATD